MNQIALRRSIIALISAVGLSSAAYAASSTFDTTAEGWTALGDAAAPLMWSGSGGNPGGHKR